MDLKRLRQILDRAAGKRILVIGDLMLDEFVWGKVGRISPEAPVPVVEVTGESFFPGGAANVARNLREFLDHVSVIGLMGKDRNGQRLRQLLAEHKIDMSDSIEDEKFPTIVKTRIIARHQQVVRVDREKIAQPTTARAGKDLLRKWAAQYLLITLGEDGVMFFEKGKRPHHIPTKARDVFDVSGAGDTAIAMFTLALVCNATPLEAAQIANHASAVVVGKLGTATVTRDQLVSSFEPDFD